MALTLSVTSYKNHAPASELSVTVNESSCTIGRAANSNFTLPDPERIVSQQHAIINYENGAYYLTDNSTNGTFVNQTAKSVGQGNRICLQDGDVLNIGEYDCVISITLQQISATDSLLDSPMWQPPLHPEAQQPDWGNETYNEPYIEPASPVMPVIPVSPVAPVAPPNNDVPLAAVEQDYFRPPEAIPEDWDELTGYKLKTDPVIAPPPITPPVMPVTPTPIKKPATPTSRKRQAAKPKRERRKSGKISSLDQQAMNAFLNGVGLTQVGLKDKDILNFMTSAGQLVREITQGFRQILDTRTSLKNEFRLGMTTIRPTENNPLKFSTDIDDTLTKLLLPQSQGYLSPIEAVQEATDDMQAHQMALLAGLRAALSSLVAHFDPDTLEKDFQKVSAIDNLLPFTRNAKYWEVFKTRYRQAAADAENDFLHFLGDEFAIAYELQIKKLKNARQK